MSAAPGRRSPPRPPPRQPEPPVPIRRTAGPLLLVASTNPAKIEEIQLLLDKIPIRVVDAERVARLSPAVEDGKTFLENARRKALHYSLLVEEVVLADDSGLVVDALGGDPGVRSARFGGPSATDLDRMRRILARLEEVPWDQRTARFVCVIAIAHRGKVLATFEGSVEGKVDFEPKGSAGFGYDPIFFYPPAERTFAEMTSEEKISVSHRGQALERAVAWLEELRFPGPPARPTRVRSKR